MAATTEGGPPQSRAAPPTTAEPSKLDTKLTAVAEDGTKRKHPHPGIEEHRQATAAKQKRLREAEDPIAAMNEEAKQEAKRYNQMLKGMPAEEVYHVDNGGCWTDAFIDYMRELAARIPEEVAEGSVLF